VPTGTAGITLSSLTIFSPIGAAPASFSKTADAASTPAGGTNGYTVTVTNPGVVPTTLTSITDSLPAGFSYVTGSTTGATTSDPAVNGQDLTWTGSFVVPAATGNTPGTLSLHFGVTVSTTPGTYTNSVTGTGTGVTVIPATDTAPITVTAVAVNHPPTVSAGGPYSGVEGSGISLTGSASDQDGDALTYAWTYSAGAGVDAGATCVFSNAAALSTTITCTDDGSFTATLTVNVGHNPAVVRTANVVVANAAPTVAITSPTDMSVVMVGQTVTVTATYADAGTNDTHTYAVDFGDGSAPATGTATGGTINATHTYAAIGTYDVTVTVTDDDGGVGTAGITLVVADQTTKVTGGGFLVADGRTSFGFVAKSDPAGGYQGHLAVRAPGKDRFHGSTVGSLVVSGNTATWSGSGRWNGQSGYTYTVAVQDNGQGGGNHKTPDTITLTIRNSSGTVVYSVSGPLKGGNITIH
jgi:uncharacterized repeat protein (TIGR01451 family)